MLNFKHRLEKTTLKLHYYKYTVEHEVSVSSLRLVECVHLCEVSQTRTLIHTSLKFIEVHLKG